MVLLHSLLGGETGYEVVFRLLNLLVLLIWRLIVLEIEVRKQSALRIACLNPGIRGLAQGERYVLVRLHILPREAPYDRPAVSISPAVPSDEVVEVSYVNR